MAVTSRIINAPRERVFDILADGWTYSDWVVGTGHIRDVDPNWPAPGAKLHHQVGAWPLAVLDCTRVLRCVAPDELVLQAGLRPFGAATVSITLAPADHDTTLVTMREEFAAGPLRWLRSKINDLALHGRNRETLRRLSHLATRRIARTTHAPADANDSATKAGTQQPATGAQQPATGVQRSAAKATADQPAADAQAQQSVTEATADHPANDAQAQRSVTEATADHPANDAQARQSATDAGPGRPARR